MKTFKIRFSLLGIKKIEWLDFHSEDELYSFFEKVPFLRIDEIKEWG